MSNVRNAMHNYHSDLFKSAQTDIAEVYRAVSVQLSDNPGFAKKALRCIKLLKLLPEAIDNALSSSDFTAQARDMKKRHLTQSEVKKELFKMKAQEILAKTIASDLDPRINAALSLWLSKQYATSLVTRDRSGYQTALDDFKNIGPVSTEQDARFGSTVGIKTNK